MIVDSSLILQAETDSVFLVEEGDFEDKLPFYAHQCEAAGHVLSGESMRNLILKPFFNKYLFSMMTAMIPGENIVRKSKKITSYATRVLATL